MNRDEKTQQIEELSGEIGKATNAFLIDFKGITVPQVTELRKQVRETKSSYLVVKNTLALIAIKDSPMVALKEQFIGPTAIAYNSSDPVGLAKALTKFAKDVPAVNFKGAMLDGQVVPASQIQAIATLPSRNELLAKVLYLMQHPIRGLAVVLQANIRNLAVVVSEIAKQKGGGDAGAADSNGEAAPEAAAPEAAAPEAVAEAAPEPNAG
jgi:large subunit ribosomal protein L10